MRTKHTGPAAKRGERIAAETRFRLRVFRGRTPAIGPGKIDLLEAIDRSGSISAAARILGMSYNRAWRLVAELNDALIRPVVAASKGGSFGGGTAITPTGLALIREYRAVEREAEAATSKRLKDIKRLVKSG